MQATRVTVQQVEKAVKERWFHKALTETKDYNAIVVMTHAGHDDPAVAAIHDTIRKIVKDDSMPIQFVAGHTHLRRYSVLDPVSTVVEAGRYLDTVGWVSFPNRDTLLQRQRDRILQGNNATADATEEPAQPPNFAEKEQPIEVTPDPVPSITADESFHHVFIDGNVDTLQQALGMSSRDEFETAAGNELKEFIHETRQKMGLTKRIGCAPRDYYLNTSMENENSLWGLFVEEVVPRELIKGAAVPRAMFLSQGSWRYDLVGGNGLTYDDVIAVSPFDDPMYLVATVPGDIVKQLNETMNGSATEEDRYYSPLPAWILSDNCVKDQECELYSRSHDIPSFKATLEKLYPNIREPISQNMTATTIWLSFVVNNWHCFEGVFDNHWWSQEAHKAIESSESSKLTAGMIALVALLVAVGVGTVVLFVCRRIICGMIRVGSRDEYGEMMTSFHSEKMDEHDAEEGSDRYDADDEEGDILEDSNVRIV